MAKHVKATRGEPFVSWVRAAVRRAWTATAHAERPRASFVSASAGPKNRADASRVGAGAETGTGKAPICERRGGDVGDGVAGEAMCFGCPTRSGAAARAREEGEASDKGDGFVEEDVVDEGEDAAAEAEEGEEKTDETSVHVLILEGGVVGARAAVRGVEQPVP